MKKEKERERRKMKRKKGKLGDLQWQRYVFHTWYLVILSWLHSSRDSMLWDLSCWRTPFLDVGCLIPKGKENTAGTLRGLKLLLRGSTWHFHSHSLIKANCMEKPFINEAESPSYTDFLSCMLNLLIINTLIFTIYI